MTMQAMYFICKNSVFNIFYNMFKGINKSSAYATYTFN